RGAILALEPQVDAAPLDAVGDLASRDATSIEADAPPDAPPPGLVAVLVADPAPVPATGARRGGRPRPAGLPGAGRASVVLGGRAGPRSRADQGRATRAGAQGREARAARTHRPPRAPSLGPVRGGGGGGGAATRESGKRAARCAGAVRGRTKKVGRFEVALRTE